VKLCVNPAHLFLGTARENNDDRETKGRTSDGPKHSKAIKRSGLHALNYRGGEDHGSAKLTDAQAREILAASGFQKDIAARYGVNQSTVSLIKSKKRRRYL
jgi:exo-beta-1,3-glucanase (GH17 family)